MSVSVLDPYLTIVAELLASVRKVGGRLSLQPSVH
jgi:hypothetical protein